MTQKFNTVGPSKELHGVTPFGSSIPCHVFLTGGEIEPRVDDECSQSFNERRRCFSQGRFDEVEIEHLSPVPIEILVDCLANAPSLGVLFKRSQ